MNEKELRESEIEGKLAYILAKTYIRIPWNKISTKSAHTFFINRVEASSGALNIRQFLENLKRRVQVEFVDIETEIMDYIDNKENRQYALRLLRKETNYIVMLALENVDKLKEAKKLRERGQSTLGGL